jgi:aspartyl protease family protein
MMTNDLQFGGLYLLMAVMLIAGALIGRRAPLARGITSVLAFVVIFGAGFIVFSFRDDLNYVAQRLEAKRRASRCNSLATSSGCHWRSTAISGSRRR